MVSIHRTQPSVATDLASWALQLQPGSDDMMLAQRALRDTVAVALAARHHSIMRVAEYLPDAARWAVASHVLDFDDLHLPSTTHISTVCVPAALATGGGAHAYLVAAGVMARLGTALGWPHYRAGWHATCTAGALAAAVGAGVAFGLDAASLATAMALAVPAAGGVQRAFGTDAKSLQVGFAVDAGIRAARLAAVGAHADPTALDAWMALVGGDPDLVDLGGPAVPGGLAVKLFPCCYALQRPLAAIGTITATQRIDPFRVSRVVVRTPAASLAPLIHHQPRTGLQGKFSIEYAVAAALLDDYQGFASFCDAAVRRPEAQRLMRLVEVQPAAGGDWLLAGELDVCVESEGGALTAQMKYPPGSPLRPASAAELDGKFRDCLDGVELNAAEIDWTTAAEILRRYV